MISAVSYTASIALSDGGFYNWDWGDFGKGVVIGGVSGAVTFGIGEAFNAAVQTATTATQTTLIEVGRVATHATFQGGLSAAQGGDFFTAFASGAAGGAIGLQAAKIGNGATIGASILVGGYTAELTGGDFWKGAAISGIVAGANHVAHRITGDGTGGDKDEDDKGKSSNNLGDISTGSSLIGEGFIMIGEARSFRLYQMGFRRGINGNYLLTGRNLSLFGRDAMTSATKPLTAIGSAGKYISGGATALNLISVGFDAYDYSNNNLSGARFGYRFTGAGLSTGGAYILGGPYGASVGTLFFVGETLWDWTESIRSEISRKYWEFENALQSGWRPR